MKIFIFYLFFLFSLNSLASYYISIGNNYNINNSIISIGGGNNYGGQALSKLSTDANYTKDIALQAFISIVKRYQMAQKPQMIDMFNTITKDTNWQNILLKVSIYDGDNIIVFFDVMHSKGRSESFTPLRLINGQWEIGSSLLQNSNVMSLFTLLLNYGKQITFSDFKTYAHFLENLQAKVYTPVFVRITKSTKNIPAYVILYYTTTGNTYNTLSAIFHDILHAYKQKNGDFSMYWGNMERENLNLMNSSSNRTLTLESTIITQLNNCRNGYTILGITDIGDITILYVLSDVGELYPFFFRKYSTGEYKMVASSVYGGCSLYALSFFTSPEFKHSFLQSTVLFSKKDAILSKLQELLH